MLPLSLFAARLPIPCASQAQPRYFGIFTRFLQARDAQQQQQSQESQSDTGILLDIAKKYFPEEQNLKECSLSDPQTKFALLNDMMDAADRNISSIELNNIRSVADALDVLSRPEFNLLDERKKTVEERLAEMKLPDNMHWIPSKHTLIREILQGDKVKE